MHDEPPRKPFQQSVECRLIIGRCKTMAMGDYVSYAELASLVGLAEVDGSLPALRTAMLRLQRDYEIVLACEPGKGVFRLTDEQIVESGATATDWIRRKAKRTVERLTVAAFDRLTNAGKHRHSALISINGALSWMTSTKQVDRMVEKMPEAKRLPVSETLEMFRKKGGST